MLTMTPTTTPVRRRGARQSGVSGTTCLGRRDRGSAPLPLLPPLLSVGGTVPQICADLQQIADICDSQSVILHNIKNHKYLD